MHSSPVPPVFVAALLGALLGLAPAPARGPVGASGPDEIALKSGGFVRGTIVAAEPGREVVVLLMGSGAQRTIPWAEVAGVQRGRYPVMSAPPAPFAAATPAYGALPTGPGYVRVHIETNTPGVELLRVKPIVGGEGGEVQDSLCKAPCDMDVDGRGTQTFRIGGDQVVTSRSFVLSDRSGDVSLRVNTASIGQSVAGLVTLTVGSLALVSGALLVAFGEADKSEAAAPGSPTPDGTPKIIAGGALLGVGVAAAVVGVVLMVTNRTHVAFISSPEATISARPLHRLSRAPLGGPLVSF